ncbi:MAG: cob(I)yrinic acid a,c-diamide adenosyltransferase [Spirochaetaceae bacterium]|jgi:cob(I)alamin adenosyltransferase|nr:cob(I)yrinic acid a,c-diamide adenosyltransferase [Spirochaetaceae bacterium]
MIHIYTGDGKGKTTAAMGLALRAAGCGRRVVIVQFMKGRDSGEISVLRSLPNVTVLRNAQDYGFFSRTSEASRAQIIAENNQNLQAALALPADLLILDEAVGAYTLGALDTAALDALLAAPSPKRELVLTGRDPPPNLIEAADYVSEIRKIKHPFDKGIKAREGIEY